MKPIFIFSLPRSGSSLLQKLILTSKSVSTVSETWILLPLFYGMKGYSRFNEYDDTIVQRALEEINKSKGVSTESLLRKLSTSIYENLNTDGKKFFLDKTPRYYYIIDDIINVFQNDAKYIFLFRNPYHIVDSLLNTWGNYGNVGDNNRDIIDGSNRMAIAYEKHSDKALKISYELLTSETLSVTREIEEFLGLSLDTENFSNSKLGALGDPTGVAKYNSISSSRVETSDIDLGKRFVLESLVGRFDFRYFKAGCYNHSVLRKELRSRPIQISTDTFRFLIGNFLNYLYRNERLNLLKILLRGKNN